MENAAIPMEIIIGSGCVRYDVLTPLIQYAYAGSKATNLNIFVDITSLLRKAIEENNEVGKYEVSSDVCISADIINLCAHYRDYFSRIGVITRFYLIYGRNCPNENLLFCGKDYNAKFTSKVFLQNQMMQIIDKNLSLLNILCTSLPGIYFFNIENYEVAGFIEHIINLYGFDREDLYPEMENMVISKDILPWQLIPRRCTVLRPRKFKGNDTSFIVSKQNMWAEFARVRQVDIQSLNMIDNKYLSNVLAMTRVPERNMLSIKNIPVVFKTILKGIELGLLPQTIMEHQLPQSTVNYALGLLEMATNYTTLEMRWKAISTSFAADAIFPNNPIWSSVLFRDVYDPNGVKEIVSKYYMNSPIDLDRL